MEAGWIVRFAAEEVAGRWDEDIGRVAGCVLRCRWGDKGCRFGGGRSRDGGDVCQDRGGLRGSDGRFSKGFVERSRAR